jgi:dihydrofolate reductase
VSRLFHQMVVTIDGFTAGPLGEFDWHPVDDDFTRYVDGMLRSIDTILLGRVTYDGLADYWPTATEPEAPLMNALPKVVVSSTLTEPAWANTTVLSGDAVAAVNALKSRTAGDVALFASGTLSSALAAAGLIDEYRVLTAPVFLGQGQPYLSALERRLPLRLLSSEHFASGLVYNRYAPAD